MTRSSAESFSGLSAAIADQFHELQNLQVGWDGKDAPPVAPEALAAAERVLAELASTFSDFREPIIVPKYDGLLQLEWHDHARTLEFEAVPNGWAVMGAIIDGRDVEYHSGILAEKEFARLEAAYRWWAERAKVWPF